MLLIAPLRKGLINCHHIGYDAYIIWRNKSVKQQLDMARLIKGIATLNLSSPSKLLNVKKVVFMCRKCCL